MSAGEYVYLNRHSVLLTGGGSGLEVGTLLYTCQRTQQRTDALFSPVQGLVGTLLPILKEFDKKTYEYIVGKRKTFKQEIVEAEFMQSNCF